LSPSEIRATGKGMFSMVGFYVECSNKNIVALNRKAHNFYFFIGIKYLTIEGIEKDAIKWYEKGKSGIIIRSNEKPENTLFSKKMCSRVKYLIDYQYNLFIKTINI